MLSMKSIAKEPQNQIYMLTSGQNMRIKHTIVNNATSRVTLKFLSAQESNTVLSSSSDQSESCLHFPLPIRKQDLALSTLSDSCALRNLSVSDKLMTI